MKTPAQSLLIIVFLVFSSVFSFSSQAMNGNYEGGSYKLTVNKLSPKQFAKGYKSERNEYKIQKNSSTRKMKRRLNGNWLQRMFSRKY